MDWLHGMFHLRDRLHSSRTSSYAYIVAHFISMARDCGLTVRVAWIFSHAGDEGNELTDPTARSASCLPFVICPGVLRDDLFAAFGRDHETWCSALTWVLRRAGGEYFERVYYKSPTPWFRGRRFPSSHITRLYWGPLPEDTLEP